MITLICITILYYIGLMPCLMWLTSGMPDINALVGSRTSPAGLIAIVTGPAPCLWAIPHMRRQGKGKNFETFGHKPAAYDEQRMHTDRPPISHPPATHTT